MTDPEITKLFSRIADAVGDTGPVDWEARPDREVTYIQPPGNVEITLRGFTATAVHLDTVWFREATQDEVSAEVRKAITGALAALVDAEVAAAMDTDYEAGDVHTKLIHLSQEAGDLFDGRLRALGGMA